MGVPAYMKYLDMQAYVGITKHIGGFTATDELLSLCHVEATGAVLNVGCGIGVTSAYIARTYGCHVVGVDVSEKMIEWSRLRAKEERVEDRVELRTANVLNLPFVAEHFDVVIAESVLSFVEDKRRAIQECVRVTRPGGYVGINETIWLELPSAEMAAQLGKYIGADIVTTEGWQDLWKESGLQEQVIQTRLVDARAEIRDRIRWVG